MKILITGASGFIGSFLAEEGVRREMAVWAGIRENSSKKYLQDEKLQFICLNFADADKLKAQIENHVEKYGKWDWIVHNAGLTKCLNREEFDEVNFVNTKNFVEALKATGNIPSKFVLMSSLSARHKPDTDYGRSKQKAEKFLEAQTEIPYIIIRPTGVYGPRDKDYFLMIKSISKGWNFSAGFEPQKLTFIYVRDLVKAVFMALESDVKQKKYTVSDGKTYTDKDFIEAVRKTLGKSHVINVKIPLFALRFVCLASELFGKILGKPVTLNRDKYKIISRRNWTCNTECIREDLNFMPDYSLERGIKECIEWYRDNRWL
jgi:nucleoside-diphosphate-sugar epimerase